MKIEIQGNCKKAIEGLNIVMPKICNVLGLQKFSSAKCLVRVERNAKSLGLTVPLVSSRINLYMMLLNYNPKRPDQIFLSACHEMIHVKQLLTGKLSSDIGGNKWCGKFYKHDTPYIERPWEINAFQNQELLLRKVIQE